MIWTIVPEEWLFRFETQEDTAFSYEEFKIDGIHMMVQKSNIETDQYEIVRLLSTNPQDYLEPQLQPGCRITSMNAKNETQ